MKAAVIGSGAMGAGIAQVIATAGHKVFLSDSNENALTKASGNIKAALNKQSDKGTMTKEKAEQTFSNIQFTQRYDVFADCDLVIEAIVEDLQIKQQLFKEIEPIVSEECVLASNTSSLSIASIASAW